MKDYEQRRASFSNSLSGLARLGGLTALAEEVGQDAEMEEGLMSPRSHQSSYDLAILPPIESPRSGAATKIVFDELSPLDYGGLATRKMPSTKLVSDRRTSSTTTATLKSGRETRTGLKPTIKLTSRDKAKKSDINISRPRETTRVQVVKLNPKDDNQTRRRSSLVEKPGNYDNESDRGKPSLLEIPHPGANQERRYSTEIDRLDSYMNREKIEGHPSRPRSQTWHTGRYLRPSGPLVPAGHLTSTTGHVDATERGSPPFDVKNTLTPSGTEDLEDKEESLDSFVRPSNRRGRRWSRPDFAETSRRVSLLLQAARATGRKGGRRLSLPAGNLPDEDFPKRPRFSSFMSAEAQFALMQGYEDRLAEWLKKKFPGYTGLRRSSTPGEGVDIKRCSLKLASRQLGRDSHDEDSFEDSSGTNSSSDDDVGDKQDVDTFPFKHGSFPNLSFTTKRNSLVPQQQHTELSDPKAALKSLRRLSNPFLRKEFHNQTLFGDESDDLDGVSTVDSSLESISPVLRRHGSLPTVSYDLPSERRLAMTRRLENAMDILDTLRAEQGEKAVLSPRAKVKKGRVAPLPDYNVWVSQWGREFKIFKGKDSPLT